MKGQTVRQIRQVHQYIGLFFAPAILFFSVSGAFQTLGMHEDRGRGKPMGWVAWMGSIHKDQEFPRPRPPRKPQQPSAGGKAPGAGPGPGSAQSEGSILSPLKVFVLGLALALISSTSLGIMIAYTNPKRRRVTSALLATGALLPVALLYLQ